MRLIEIPLKEAESVVEIPVVDLPESFDQIFDLLVSESCQLSLFVTFAVRRLFCMCDIMNRKS